VIAGYVHANDHHRAGDLVLGLTGRDGRVADGTGFTGASTPDDVTIGQGPQRAVNESFSDAGEEIHVHISGSFGGRLITRQDAIREARRDAGVGAARHIR
jgi:hypothetical protein